MPLINANADKARGLNIWYVPLSASFSVYASSEYPGETAHMRGSRKFFSEGVQLFFQIPLKSGHHRPASETPLQ